MNANDFCQTDAQKVRWRSRRFRLWHATAAVGRRFKQGQQIGHAEELADLLAEIDEIKPAAGGFR